MYYKVLYYEPKNVIDYAKWLNRQYYDNKLRLIAINRNYHVFVEKDG